TKEEFLALVDKMRSRIPDLSLSTDVIVGFPTETDEEFEDTVDVMRKVQFDQAFMFKYSERKGTIASKKFPDDISEETKSLRVTKLVNMQKDIVYERNKSFVGKVCNVLVEPAIGDKSPQNTVARTDGNHLVIIADASYPIGSIVKVKVIDATPHVLRAVVV
ncbi:MAG: TRAM domain-containing protein, partial [Candidatus Omnitrophica bacterium]|nr:TRAM domain-containing protein [Candidatus Omnitrophota bacterium]